MFGGGYFDEYTFSIYDEQLHRTNKRLYGDVRNLGYRFNS